MRDTLGAPATTVYLRSCDTCTAYHLSLLHLQATVQASRTTGTVVTTLPGLPPPINLLRQLLSLLPWAHHWRGMHWGRKQRHGPRVSGLLKNSPHLVGVSAASSTATRGAELVFKHGRRVVLTPAGGVRRLVVAPATNPPSPLLFLVLTVNPCISPSLPFSHRLIQLEEKMKALADSLAIVSTLGGGYFLIKDIAHSISLARKQAALALELGDSVAWRASHLHLVYIAIQCGAWEHGVTLISDLMALAVAAGDKRLVAMLNSATGYLGRTREWYEAGKLCGEDVHRQSLAVYDKELLDKLVGVY